MNLRGSEEGNLVCDEDENEDERQAQQVIEHHHGVLVQRAGLRGGLGDVHRFSEVQLARKPRALASGGDVMELGKYFGAVCIKEIRPCKISNML